MKRSLHVELSELTERGNYVNGNHNLHPISCVEFLDQLSYYQILKITPFDCALHLVNTALGSLL
jgi:hypothetical protein